MIKDRRAQAQFISYDSLSVSRNMNVDETGKGIFHPADIDAIHDTVHEIAKDEARHGKAFAGLLKRYFGE